MPAAHSRNLRPVLIRFVSALNKRGSVRLRMHASGIKNLDETPEHLRGSKMTHAQVGEFQNLTSPCGGSQNHEALA